MCQPGILKGCPVLFLVTGSSVTGSPPRRDGGASSEQSSFAERQGKNVPVRMKPELETRAIGVHVLKTRTERQVREVTDHDEVRRPWRCERRVGRRGSEERLSISGEYG